MLLSIRQYAVRRGVSHTAVNKAVRAGKIPLTDGKIDPAAADAAWERNRDSRQPSKLAVGAQAPAPERTGPQSRPEPGVVPPVVRHAASGTEGPRPGTLAHAQLLRETAKAKRAAIEVQQMEGKLLAADEVSEAWSGMISATKSKLLVVGDEIADRLAAASDPVACREIVDEKIAEALAELAEYPARAA